MEVSGMIKYWTYAWDLERAIEAASSAFCKTPATFIDSIHPNTLLEKAKNPETWFNSQQILSYCLGLCTQKPRLRQVDLEPSPTRGSDMIKMLR